MSDNNAGRPIWFQAHIIAESQTTELYPTTVAAPSLQESAFITATMTSTMQPPEGNDEERAPSPVSIVEYNDNSLSSHRGLSGLLLECEEDIQREKDLARSPSNRSRRSLRTLPTLKETEETPESPEPSIVKTLDLRPVESKSLSPQESYDEEGGLDHSEIKLLNSKASNYALRGNEQEALRMYKRALRLTRLEVARINKQLQQSQKREKYAKTTIHLVLHDEWTEVALIIANIRTMMAILYERIGDYERAVMCCNEAFDVYERQSKFDKTHYKKLSNAADMMDRMHHMTTKMEDANDTYETRKQLHEDSVETHRQICITTDPAVRDLLYEALFDKLSAALGLELESLGRNHPQVSDTMTFLGKLHFERSEVDKALHSMNQAITTAEVSLGTMHPRTGEKYRDIARIFEDARRNDADVYNAIFFYEKAITTFRDADGDYSHLIGSVLNDVGVLYIQKQQYDVAVQKLSDALDAYQASPTVQDCTYADTVQVWRNLAECYVLRKEWSSASMAFKSALAVQRDARRLYDAASKEGTKDTMPNLVSDESIADTLKRLGKSFAAQQQYEKSFGTLLEALTLFQTVYEKAQTPEKQDQVANIIYCLAEVKEADKKYGDALKLYEESLQLRTASDKLRSKKLKSNYVHCAMCLAGIGSCRMARKEYDGAFKAYNKALQCTRSEKLPEFHPIVRMLWDKSRTAARKMGKASVLEKNVSLQSSGDSTIDDSTGKSQEKAEAKLPLATNGNVTSVDHNTAGQASSWFYTVSRLQKKAKTQKSKGDIDGAIESTKIVLELRRATLMKKEQSKRTCTKEQRQVATTLVSLAHLVLIKDATRQAELLFKEADELYKASGMARDDDCLQDICRELERLRWQQNSACNHRRK